MNNDQYNLNLTAGMDVKGSDGEKVGTVQDIQGNYVVVSKGFFFPHDYYIPFSAITTADGDNVYLNVTKDQALNQGWDAIPDTTTTTTSTVYDDQAVVDREVEADSLGYAGGQETYVDTAATAGTAQVVDADETIEVALTEEELTARTREVQRGEVRIEKDVVAEEQTLEVPVTEERVHVSRRVVDRDVLPGDATFEEGVIEVPVYGEEVELEKRTRVREELEITKDKVQDTERVSGTVRHEEVRVTDETGVVVDDDTQTGTTRRQ